MDLDNEDEGGSDGKARIVSQVITDAEGLSERLCPTPSNHAPHIYASIDDRIEDLSKLVVLLTKMNVPFFRSYYNGGVPSKKAGKRLEFTLAGAKLSIPRGDLSLWIFRGLILFGIFYRTGTVSPKDILNAVTQQVPQLTQTINTGEGKAAEVKP